MSRVLTTLLLYKSGFMVGKYISIENKIEKTKHKYYDTLREISEGWHEQKNNYSTFIKYILSIILNSYRDLESRLILVDLKEGSYEGFSYPLPFLFMPAFKPLWNIPLIIGPLSATPLIIFFMKLPLIDGTVSKK
jgi:hypothetical protein